MPYVNATADARALSGAAELETLRSEVDQLRFANEGLEAQLARLMASGGAGAEAADSGGAGDPVEMELLRHEVEDLRHDNAEMENGFHEAAAEVRAFVALRRAGNVVLRPDIPRWWPCAAPQVRCGFLDRAMGENAVPECASLDSDFGSFTVCSCCIACSRPQTQRAQIRETALHVPDDKALRRPGKSFNTRQTSYQNH